MPRPQDYHRDWRKNNPEKVRNAEKNYRDRQKGLIPPPVVPTPRERFDQNYIPVTESGCWLWTEQVNHKGYALMKIHQKPVIMHRWAYEHFVGQIPEGLQIDHLCAVKCCVNPMHLEPVTGLVNIRRRKERTGYHVAPKTHCPQGHEYTPQNTTYSGPKQQYRMCRTCRNAKCLAYYYRRRYRL